MPGRITHTGERRRLATPMRPILLSRLVLLSAALRPSARQMPTTYHYFSVATTNAAKYYGLAAFELFA